MKKIVLIIGFIVVGVLIYFAFNMYPFAKGVINNIPKNEKKTISKRDNEASEKSDQYPKWINRNYLTKNKNSTNRYLTTEIIEFKIINDSISIVLYEQNSGVCNIRNIDTYKNQEKVDKLEVETSCDMDLSRSHFTWKTYQLKNKNYHITEFNETANDTLIETDGFLKTGYSFDEIETETDSIVKVYKISNNGKILEIKENNDL